MSHRNKIIRMLLAVVCVALPCAALQVQAGDGLNPKTNQKNIFIRFYQDHISGADGGRCPMTPSCSEYAARAIKKHGPVIGYIMACDRLMRCGRDEMKISPTVFVNHQPYASDPVYANDFWWFKQKADLSRHEKNTP